jgi:hypothetical protein
MRKNSRITEACLTAIVGFRKRAARWPNSECHSKIAAATRQGSRTLSDWSGETALAAWWATSFLTRKWKRKDGERRPRAHMCNVDVTRLNCWNQSELMNGMVPFLDNPT